MRQFSAADGSNPLADFKAGALDSINQAANRSDATERALLSKLGELQKELQALRDEKDKLEEVAAERERGTAKGRTFEEPVADSVDALALPRATWPRRSATSPAPPARRATWSWPSAPATARRAGGSCSRPRTGGCRSPRR